PLDPGRQAGDREAELLALGGYALQGGFLVRSRRVDEALLLHHRQFVRGEQHLLQSNDSVDPLLFPAFALECAPERGLADLVAPPEPDGAADASASVEE